jgi:hypothetical protein
MIGTERGRGEKGERVESWRIRETDRQKSKQRFKKEKNRTDRIDTSRKREKVEEKERERERTMKKCKERDEYNKTQF